MNCKTPREWQLLKQCEVLEQAARGTADRIEELEREVKALEDSIMAELTRNMT